MLPPGELFGVSWVKAPCEEKLGMNIWRGGSDWLPSSSRGMGASHFLGLFYILCTEWVSALIKEHFLAHLHILLNLKGPKEGHTGKIRFSCPVLSLVTTPPSFFCILLGIISE